jgi:AraC family transcriptional regulator, regulatory protein of adaptative response / methylated-DNA-[protein]-cysteine methyltransferase
LHQQPRITDAIYEAGYGSSSRAYENGSERLGMTPTSFRRGGEGVRIRYTITPSQMGKLLIAATQRGVCSVRFGNNDRDLEKELRREFNAAEIARDDQALRSLVEKVRGLFGRPMPAGSIPLDIQGTAFQQRVWDALRRIPRGETRSYTEIAKQIGKPKAVRAVANACASNPVAVVVPCHRVVARSGSLAGYRWGVERKQALLRAEQTSNNGLRSAGENQIR